MDEASTRRARETMVDLHIRQRGISNPRLLEAMRTVPREEFVPSALRRYAFNDSPLPIEHGQTISQPYIVAWSINAADVQPGDRVLDVGVGTGYSSAVLAALGAHVVGIERIPDLARTARRRLARLGIPIDVFIGDGTLGLPQEAPFDAIIAGAAGPRIPTPWIDQLVDGGRIVMPLDVDGEQRMIRAVKHGSDIRVETLEPVRFVPLVGAHGHAESS